MPQEPKKKHSKSRKRIRRSSIMLESLGVILCPNCKMPTIPHQVCKNCGQYKGKQVKVKTAVKVTKA